MTQDKGFLLSYLKYGDNDAIAHIFTKENGYESFFIKGIYSPRNRKKAYLQPLNELDFTLSNRLKSGAIKNISKIEALGSLDENLDVRTNSVVFFIADFLNQVLRNETCNPSIYKEIDVFKSALNQRKFQSHLIFLVNILNIHGLNPLFSDQKFLNPESGNFTDYEVHNLFNEEISEIWKQIISAETPYEIKIEPKKRKDFLDSILVYYHYHFSDFRTPGSLEIIQQIF